MVSIPKVVGLLSCGFLLCLGLSTAAQAEDMKAGQSERNGGQADQKEMTLQKPWGHFIQGDVLRVEHAHYFVKDKDGKTVRLETDTTTQLMGQYKKGDRILANVNDQNHALSIIPAP